MIGKQVNYDCITKQTELRDVDITENEYIEPKKSELILLKEALIKKGVITEADVNA